MQKREAAFTTRLNLWLEYVYLPSPHAKSAPFEVKYSLGSPIYFSEIRPQQRISLLHAKHRYFKHKISDDSRDFKPFDGFMFKKSHAWMILGFSQNVYMIDIDTWVTEEETSTRRSITEERAAEIAQIKGRLGSRKLSTSTP